MKAICLSCKTEFDYYPSGSRGKYCSNKCQQDFQKQKIIEDWKSGKYDGVVSKNSIASLSGTIRSYLMEKHNNCCVECGWGKRNLHTNRIPLHVHHNDGNAFNNQEENLKLLCPCCHSLTENYGKLNKSCKRKKKKIVYQ